MFFITFLKNLLNLKFLRSAPLFLDLSIYLKRTEILQCKVGQCCLKSQDQQDLDTLSTLSTLNIQAESKKCDLRRLVLNCTFLFNSPVWCVVNIFLEICNVFGIPMVLKNLVNLFSLKIKSLGKQKCEY